eukprot:COSAG06_NODE_1108_length_10655_cov_33.558450_6_plen_105_part_00
MDEYVLTTLPDDAQHKCDLRVYVAVSPEGKAFVYQDAALRSAINEFDPSDLSPKTMVTHPCVIRPTDKVQRSTAHHSATNTPHCTAQHITVMLLEERKSTPLER